MHWRFDGANALSSRHHHLLQLRRHSTCLLYSSALSFSHLPLTYPSFIAQTGSFLSNSSNATSSKLSYVLACLSQLTLSTTYHGEFYRGQRLHLLALPLALRLTLMYLARTLSSRKHELHSRICYSKQWTS